MTEIIPVLKVIIFVLVDLASAGVMGTYITHLRVVVKVVVFLTFSDSYTYNIYKFLQPKFVTF